MIKPFRFEAMWLKHRDFPDLVKKIWKDNLDNELMANFTMISGTKMVKS